MKSNHSCFRMLLLACGTSTFVAFAPGCGADATEESDTVPAKEVLAVDEQYMAGLLKARGGESSMHVDLSDDAQYGFVIHRFLAAGKNPDNSPELFKRLEARRNSLRGEVHGILGTASSALTTDVCGHALPTIESKVAGGSLFKGSSLGSCKGGVDYMYSDLDTYYTNKDGTGYTDVDFTYGEDYTGGIGFRVNAPDLTIAAGKVYALSSMLYAADATGDAIIYTLNNSLVANQPPRVAVTHPTEQYNDPVTNTDDADPVNNFLGRTRFCIQRGGTDCDYAAVNAAGQAWWQNPVGIGVTKVPPTMPWTAAQIWAAPAAFNPKHMYIPLVGSFDAGTDMNGSACKITKFLEATTAKIFLFDKVGVFNTGAVCKIAADQSAANDNSALLTALKAGLNQVGSGQSSTMNFKLLADFGVDCTGYEQRVVLHIDIKAVTTCSGAIKSANWPGPLNGNNKISPLDFKNSCVAEGTRVLRSDGTYVAIERVEAGERIIADQSGVALTVMGVSVGHEDEPVVRVLDDQGHGLLITAKHPVVTASKSLVAAGQLQVGDKVMTEYGISTIASVSREDYAGRVYNLTVGNRGELASLKNPDEQRTMYANGFLIGDSDMQWNMGQLKQNMSIDPISKLPEVWHNDYKNSVVR